MGCGYVWFRGFGVVNIQGCVSVNMTINDSGLLDSSTVVTFQCSVDVKLVFIKVAIRSCN